MSSSDDMQEMVRDAANREGFNLEFKTSSIFSDLGYPMSKVNYQLGNSPTVVDVFAQQEVPRIIFSIAVVNINCLKDFIK